MTAWQKLLLAFVGKIRVHHGGAEHTDLHALKLVYSGMNSQQKKYRKARKREKRHQRIIDNMKIENQTIPSPLARSQEKT